MRIQLEFISADTLSVEFPYDAGRVACLKLLARRKWNPTKKRWEVHLSHLPELMRIFRLMPADVPPPILLRFQKCWAAEAPLRVELGVLEGRLVGRAPLEAIDEVTSYEVPGAEYSELFKQGRWDGRRHLFNRQTQTFPAGLWQRVRAELEKAEVNYELADAGEALEPGPTTATLQPLDVAGLALPVAPDSRPLRPYQAQALQQAAAVGRGIVQIATGGGKTLLAAHLIRQLDCRTIFFVHTLDLLYQAARVFERELGVEIGLLGDGQAVLRPITVATVQTASRLYDAASVRASDKAQKLRARRNRTKVQKAGEEEEPAQREERPLDVDDATRREISLAIAHAQVVIFDECHHVPADTFYKIAMKTRAARWRFGLSATPWRDDCNDLLLEAALGPRICSVNCSTLIEAGFLIGPRIRMVSAPGPRMARRGAKYPDVYTRAIVENRERNRVIAVQARQWVAAGHSVLILVAHVTHGNLLLEELPEAVFCWGGLDGATRQSHLKALEQKLAPIMIATTLADEGLDVPSLGGVILAGGGKSPTRAFQRIGRALRPAPGKTEALILDFFDDVPYLRDHSLARLELYRQEPRFQLEADALPTVANRICPTAC
jgi:superfamily II DNA or RNA helicase